MATENEIDEFLEDMLCQWQSGDGRVIFDALLKSLSCAEKKLIEKYGEDLRCDLNEYVSLQIEQCRLFSRYAFQLGCKQAQSEKTINLGGMKNDKKRAVGVGSSRVVILDRVRNEG